MDASIEYCKNNKPELYYLIEQGKAENLPGVDLEYEIPTNPEMTFKPRNNEENLDKILDYLAAKKIFPNH